MAKQISIESYYANDPQVAGSPGIVPTTPGDVNAAEVERIILALNFALKSYVDTGDKAVRDAITAAISAEVNRANLAYAAANHSHFTYLKESDLNLPGGPLGLDENGQIPEELFPSYIKNISEKQGTISGIYTVAGNLYNGIIADINGDTTINVSQAITDQFEIILYNGNTISHLVKLGTNLWKDADGDSVVASIRGSAQYESVTLVPGGIYRAKAFATGKGLAIEANLVGTQGSVEWDAINNRPTTLSGFGITDAATAEQGVKADNALPASSYTAADILSKLLTVDSDTAGINATTVKSIQPGMGGLVLLALSQLGSGWSTLFQNAKPTTRAGYGITDAAANTHYHSVSDISDFPDIKGVERIADPVSGAQAPNVALYKGYIARMNGDLTLNFSGTIYGDYDICILNNSGATRNLELNFSNAVLAIKGSAPSTSITITNGQLYRAKLQYLYAGTDGLVGEADVN